MTANSGTGLYIRKVAGNVGTAAHTGAFSEKATISGSLTTAKFEPCTSATSTTTTDTEGGTSTTKVTPNKFNEFKPTFATLSKVETSKLTYVMLGTDGTGTQIASQDIYGTVKDTTKTVGDNGDTTAYYYNFKIDYMISTSSKDKLQIGVENVKVTGKDKYTNTEGSTTTEETVDVVIAGSYKAGEYYYGTDGTVKLAGEDESGTATAGTDDATLDKATRVAFIDAATYPDTDIVTYGNSGEEYAIADTCTETDHNLNALKELGYTGTTSEYDTYDQGQTVLSTTATHSVKTPEGTTAKTKTTSDGSFTYGSVDVYVWFDGTDKACTNAIFSQKVTFDLKYKVV